MYYLIYVSYATDTPNSEDLKQLAQISHVNNQKIDVSGMLIYLDGKYLQVLEGKKSAVLELFDKISKDPRHQQIRVLIEGDIEKVS